MGKQQRRRFLTLNDWYNFLNEIKQQQDTSINLLDLRIQVYKEIEELRERPLLVYATQFINPPKESHHLTINLTDIDGFTDLISTVSEDHSKIDILLHSPGGSPDSTERIVNLIRNRFDHVSFLIPHSAYSAATMMALSGNEIILHPSATLGPIDPQINGTPARAFIRGFEKVRDLIQNEGPSIVPAYLPMLRQYSLHFLEQCKDAESLSTILAKEWITKYMFGEANVDEQDVDDLVTFLSNYDSHKIHSRPIYFDKISQYKINATKAEGELKDLMREAHILLNGFFDITPFIKVYENSKGLSYGRQIQSTLKKEKGKEDDEKSPN